MKSENLQAFKTSVWKRRNDHALSLFLLSFAIISCAPVVFAQGLGDLLITPTRLVFDGNKRSESINLINVGTDTATYSISLVQYRMTEIGGFQEITEPDPGQQFADKFLRYFPKQVVLPPNEAQNIRVQVVKPQDLPDGEYRSHMYFRAIPKPKPIETLEDTVTEGFSVQLTAIYGVSIPIIVRHGKLSAAVTLSDLALTYERQGDVNRPFLSMVMNRTGNQSVYGDFIAKLIDSKGKETDAGEVKGIAVYTPNTHRTFQMPLQLPEGTTLKNCRIVAEFRSRNEVKENLVTRAELVIP